MLDIRGLQTMTKETRQQEADQLLREFQAQRNPFPSFSAAKAADVERVKKA